MNAQQPDRDSEAYASWQRAVAGVLTKTRGLDADDMGPEPERLLDTPTYDDVTVAPLYTRFDELPEEPAPGQAPYTRGGKAAGDRGWGVCARYGELGDAAIANRRILDDLQNGVTSIWLSVDRESDNGVAPREVRAALEGVLLDLAPVRLDAGADFGEAAEELFSVLDDASVEDPTRVRVSLGADPWTVQIRAGSPVAGATLDDAVALAVRAASRPERIRALTVDGTVFHDAGASDAEELGASLAAGLAYVRALVDAGLDSSVAFDAIEFRHAVADDQFAGIAKLRAARKAWARIITVAGAHDAGPTSQHAVTSAAMMSQRDPWVNMLRTTLAGFAAGAGGATDVTVLPFDHALPGSVSGVSGRFASRLARNTQLLLLEESHVGDVADPAGGSWFVERHTDELAERAWTCFQELERAGGFAAALEAGVVAERIAAVRSARTADIAHRRTSVTGVNEFPNLDEPAIDGVGEETDGGLLPRIRYAEPFEALRDRSDRHLDDTGARPRVFLATLGSIAEHNQRATYARNLLASAGIDTTESGPVDEPAAARQAWHDTGLSVAVLCGTDDRYATIGSETVGALRSDGAERVYAVGAGDSFVATDGVPDDYLVPGIDVVDTMSSLLDLLEVAR